MVSSDRVPRWNSEYFSVNAPWTYFFSPAAPDRSVVSSNPTTLEAMISVLISFTTPRPSTRPCGQEWMNPADTSAPATSDSSSRHRSTAGAEHQEVDRQAHSRGPIETAESGRRRRAT